MTSSGNEKKVKTNDLTSGNTQSCGCFQTEARITHNWFWNSSCISDYSERSKFRSKTFEGIAKAMAEQWGGFIEKELKNK